jgi:riboflavin synthase
MFTGIIQAVGSLATIEPREGDIRVRIDAGVLDLRDTGTGDSIAVNGVCLTAVEVGGSAFAADVSRETLACTTFHDLRAGARVNLEKALTPTSHLGGHLVSGHVDGVGEVLERRAEARSVRFRIRLPAPLARYVAAKGSVCVDGVSLTVNDVQGNEFGVNVVPHTLEATTLGSWQAGRRVNIEVDQVARYVERLLSGDVSGSVRPAGGIAQAFLVDHGFLKR